MSVGLTSGSLNKSDTTGYDDVASTNPNTVIDARGESIPHPVCKGTACHHKGMMVAVVVMMTSFIFGSCQEEKEHTAPPIYPRDSVAIMTTFGINTLISDSGVIKYRIVAERWEVNENINPPRWIFDKGIFLEQFDEKFHIQAYIQSDTAYYFEKMKIWELRGRVNILTKTGVHFTSEQLFWDENKHELYSSVPSRLVTPDRTLEGTYFRSDERMTRYTVSNSKGSFEKSDLNDNNDTLSTAPDTIKERIRPQALPQRKPHNNISTGR